MTQIEKTQKTKKSGLAFPAFCFVLGGVFTAFINLYTGSILQERGHKLEIDRAAQVAAYQSFQDVAFDFEERGRMFVLAQESEPAVLKLQKEELLRNLSKQVSAAEKLRPYVENKNVLDQYMDAALQVQEEVNRDLPFEEIKPFWSASQELLLQRVEVVSHIESN